MEAFNATAGELENAALLEINLEFYMASEMQCR